MTTPKSSASSFIEQIKAEYREVVSAEATALPHAIRCGEFLNLAKENVKTEGGKWSDWLKANCPEIAQETASLYMRLAGNKKLVAKAKSIREARELLPKGKPRAPKPQSVELRPANSPTFEAELEVRAPDELFPVLVEHWEDNELEQLVKLIGEHLEKKRAATSAVAATPRPPISNAVTNPPPSNAVRRAV